MPEKTTGNNTKEGSTILGFRFDSEEKAEAFAKKVGGGRPINNGKHLQTNLSTLSAPAPLLRDDRSAVQVRPQVTAWMPTHRGS